MTRALEGRTDEDLARQPAPGEWSARQALEHLLFCEELLAKRIGRLLDEEEPDLAAAAVWADTPASDEGSTSTDEPASVIAARIAELRHATVGRLASLPESSWGRGGTHPEWGRVTVLSQAAYFARHEASHLAQLVAAAEGRLPGRGPRPEGWPPATGPARRPSPRKEPAQNEEAGPPAGRTGFAVRVCRTVRPGAWP